ncbi:Hypothetical predicted protein, partial [Paramuricea clavata]
TMIIARAALQGGWRGGVKHPHSPTSCRYQFDKVQRQELVLQNQWFKLPFINEEFKRQAIGTKQNCQGECETLTFTSGLSYEKEARHEKALCRCLTKYFAYRCMTCMKTFSGFSSFFYRIRSLLKHYLNLFNFKKFGGIKSGDKKYQGSERPRTIIVFGMIILIYSVVSTRANDEWTLIARFSNDDSKYWIDDGSFWYDKDTSYGDEDNPSSNKDMISAAFWETKGHEIKITRSDDHTHTALLQTTSNCLQGGTFRSKITSYGNFRNGAVWASDQCLGSCPVTYGGQYKTTAGFEQHSCSSDIQNSGHIGFWCDWGDGAVMMIGGGGKNCGRADHGIGITGQNKAKFGGNTAHYDFGKDMAVTLQKSYSLNLWVR